MKKLIILIIPLITILFSFQTTPEDLKLTLNGKDVKDKISLKETGKIQMSLPEGWRFISGKVKIKNEDQLKKDQQITGETAFKEFDLMQFIKLNAASGDKLSIEFSVRTRESSKFLTKKIPIE